MKKILSLVIFTVLMTLGNFGQEANAQSAKITKAYLEHNQYVNGNKVMYVRYGIETFGLKNKKVKCVVSLYKKSTGKPVTDYNGKKMSNTIYMTPAYDDTVYNSNYAWFSYAHMKLPKGRTDCYALIRIYNSAGKLLKTSQKLDFWVDKN